eukprot:m.346158 g.346158  ORF g.346158 m.346158 type:complete len:864 (-) comp28255_c0_seq1:58-2649(-)
MCYKHFGFIALILLGLNVSEIGAMIFKPKDPNTGMWDTWLYASELETANKEGIPQYYLNYLSNAESPRWNGVNSVISNDGVHFTDLGQQIKKDENVTWLGSGSVWKQRGNSTTKGNTSNACYIMNFSQDYNGNPKTTDWAGQRIFFAKSCDNLKTWQRVTEPGHMTDYVIFDYNEGMQQPGYVKGGRWDCIATVPKPGGGYYGYWTATPLTGGGAGFGETIDDTGYHWKADTPITEGLPKAEVGAVVVIQNKYYMLFSGGHLYTSNKPSGPFSPDPKNPNFMVDGQGVHFTRFWNIQNDTGPTNTVLVTHQFCPDSQPAQNGCYLGVVKQAVVGDDGSLRAMWWAGNAALIGNKIPITIHNATPTCSPGVQPCVGRTASPSWIWPAETNNAARIQVQSMPSYCLGFDNKTGWGYLQNCEIAPMFTKVADGGNGTIHIISQGLCLTYFTGHMSKIRLLPCSNSYDDASQKWMFTPDGLLHASGTTPLSLSNGGLVALYRFDSVDIGKDDSGAQNNLVVKGQGATASTNNGRMCLHLDGSSYLTTPTGKVPPGTPLGNSSYTVSAWVLLNPASSVLNGVVGWGDFASDLGSNALSSGGTDGFWNYWYNGGNEPQNDLHFTTPGLSNETWNHIACRFDQDARTCFWNGIQVAQDFPPTKNTRNANFRVGNNHFSEFWHGYLDEVAVFSHPLTDSQIQQAMLGDYVEGRCLYACMKNDNNNGTLHHWPVTGDFDFNTGIVFNATIEMQDVSGLWVELQNGQGAALLWDGVSGQIKTGVMSSDGSWSPDIWDHGVNFTASGPGTCTALLRAAPGGKLMTEFYVNGILGHPVIFSGMNDQPAVHIITSGVTSTTSAYNAFAMTLDKVVS